MSAIPRAYTRAEFCSQVGRMSRATYYRLKAQGLAPDETWVGTSSKNRKVIITEEAATEWLQRMTKRAAR